MTLSTSALDVSGLTRPTRPSAEDEAQIVRSFRLSDAQRHELRLVIDHFMMDVDAYLAELARISPRSERALRLRRIEKALRRLKYEVEKSGDVLDQLLPFELSETLGGKLTFAAIGDAVGSPQAPRNFMYVAATVATRDGSLSMQGLDMAFEPERRALGLKHPGATFRSMINDLYAPLGRWVELDKKVSGRQPMRFRNLLIERLAEASEGILQTRAKTTAAGRFVELCAAVLDAMQIPSDGVEKAVAAVLKAVKENAMAQAKSNCPPAEEFGS